MSAENPRKWRYTWEAQSHSPTLRLFLFDSHSNPSIQCKNLDVKLNLPESQLLITWIDEDREQVFLTVPIPRVLIDSESPVSFRAMNDHVEVKLVLLLPVDHPLVLSFDSVMNFSEDGENETSDVAKPLVMDSDVKSLSSSGGVHFYCRSCSTRLTRTPLRDFVEMPSTNWREVADNWFGACCCSFGGISEKIVARYANSYTCTKGLSLVNFTTVTLSKEDLVECKFFLHDGSQSYNSEPALFHEDGLSDSMLSTGSSYGVAECDSQCKIPHDFSEQLSLNDNLAAKINCEDTEEANYGSNAFSTLSEKGFSENVVSEPGCCDHTACHVQNHPDEVSTYDVTERFSVGITNNQKSFINGFLGNIFMARSSYISKDIEWIEFLCPQCSSFLGACPCGDGNGNAPVDGGVRLFKCYISTSLPSDRSRDLFRKYSLERMFTNQLVDSAKDELSFRTVVKDVTTKSPMLQIVLLNPNSWCCIGHCFGLGEDDESVSKLELHPVVKVLFSDCSNSTDSQLRMLEDWTTKGLADEVYMFAHQIKQLIEFLTLAKDMLPFSCSYLQGLPLSTMKSIAFWRKTVRM